MGSVALGAPAQTATTGPVLNVRQAVVTALQNRPLIRAAQEKVRAALANQSALSANGATRLEFAYDTRPELGIGNDLFLAQPIDLAGKTRAARDSGKAGVLGAQAQLRQAELDLQTLALNAYADAYSAQELLKTGSDLADLSQKSYDATDARIKAGDLPPAQLLRADLDLRQAKQTLRVREQGWEAARVRLAAALGVEPSTIGSVDPSIPASALMQTLTGRGDVQQARSEIASAHADAAAALASRWPDLEIQMGRSPWDQPAQYSAWVQFVWPIFDFGASREKLRQARANQQAATDTLKDTIEQANREIHAAQLDYQAAQASSQGFAALADDARGLLQKEQAAFTAGANTLLDVLDATRSLREVEESSVAAKVQWIQAEARLLAATGTLLTEQP